jgi:hypothetical protein
VLFKFGASIRSETIDPAAPWPLCEKDPSLKPLSSDQPDTAATFFTILVHGGALLEPF